MRAASLDAVDDLDAIVSGIAHDFGNVLAVVTNYVSLAARRVDDPTTTELLASASKGARRAARLTRQLHDLGDCGGLVAEPVPVNELVRRANGLLAEGLAQGCELRLDLADGPGHALASARGLEMALGHLVQNACEAMPEGGVVTISTRAIDAGSGPAGVEVRVSDLGTGMPPDVVARAVEPRFSTQPHGQTGGLGLTIAARAVDRLGGELQIESAVGAGTTVRLLFQGVTSHG